MPSKSNERFLRADRKNRLEKHRLDGILRCFDRESTFKSLEIDREKKLVVKSFDVVRKTSGRSDQGVPPKNKNDNRHLGDPVYQMGLRLSERRLMEWRDQERELQRAQSRSRSRIGSVAHSLKDFNGNRINEKQTRSAVSLITDEEVYSINGSLRNLTFDPDELSNSIQEDYKALFSKCDFKIDLKHLKSRKGTKSLSDMSRPHTANIAVRSKGRDRTASLPVRPKTATSVTSSHRKHRSEFLRTAISEYSSDGTHETDDVVLEDYNAITSNTDEVDSVKNENHSESEPEYNSENESESDNSDKRNSERKRSLHRKISHTKIADTIPEDEVFTSSTVNESIKENPIKENEESENRPKRRTSSARRKSSQAVYTIEEEPTQDAQNTSNEAVMESTKTETEISSETSGSRSRKLSSSGRQRKVSISTVSSDTRGSGFGSVFGSISDLSLDSNGQRKPSRWREFVAADNAPLPQKKSFVNVTTIVRAALAFSKSARKRALDKLVEEQSADAGEIMRQERLRRLHSRNEILNAIANNWTVSNEEVGLKPNNKINSED